MRSSATPQAEADAAWADIARIHGLEGRIGSDGGERGLAIGGRRRHSRSYFDGYRRNGVGEVIFVFRSPFDLESIARIGEVRDALG